jgi:hypothetical protein
MSANTGTGAVKEPESESSTPADSPAKEGGMSADRPLPPRTLQYIATGAQKGHRNEELLAAACQCRDAGCSIAETETLLLPRAQRDGLSGNEARRTIQSAFSQPARSPLTASTSSTPAPRRVPTPEERERIEADKQKLRLRAQAETAASSILQENARGFTHYGNESPVYLFDGDSRDDWRLLLKLFKPDDVLWIGRTTQDSANEKHDPEWKTFCRTRFRPVSEWLKEPIAPGLFTCPSVFKAGVHSRSNENAILRRYLVVESDSLDKNQVCAVFHWLEQFCRLRAIVDTAGKSLHGWFEPPDPTMLEQLKVILPAVGCDGAMFKLSQPCRLPGGSREGRIQSLLYLDLEGRR